MTCSVSLMHVVRCRAKIAGGCLDGDTTTEAFGEDVSIMNDSTFVMDDDGGTIVCDACLVRLTPILGTLTASNDEISSALAKFVTLRDGHRQPDPLD